MYIYDMQNTKHYPMKTTDFTLQAESLMPSCTILKVRRKYVGDGYQYRLEYLDQAKDWNRVFMLPQADGTWFVTQEVKNEYAPNGWHVHNFRTLDMATGLEYLNDAAKV